MKNWTASDWMSFLAVVAVCLVVGLVVVLSAGWPWWAVPLCALGAFGVLVLALVFWVGLIMASRPY